MVWLYNIFNKGSHVIYVNKYQMFLFCMQSKSIIKKSKMRSFKMEIKVINS